MTQNLYNVNVRKVVVMGLAPIGCAPHYLWEYGSENGECVEQINDMVMEFNFLMRYNVERLAEELADFSIIFCDVSEGSMDILKNHERYGTRTSICYSPPQKSQYLVARESITSNSAFYVL